MLFSLHTYCSGLCQTQNMFMNDLCAKIEAQQIIFEFDLSGIRRSSWSHRQRWPRTSWSRQKLQVGCVRWTATILLTVAATAAVHFANPIKIVSRVSIHIFATAPLQMAGTSSAKHTEYTLNTEIFMSLHRLCRQRIRGFAREKKGNDEEDTRTLTYIQQIHFALEVQSSAYNWIHIRLVWCGRVCKFEYLEIGKFPYPSWTLSNG